jgi:hypothetical protein
MKPFLCTSPGSIPSPGNHRSTRRRPYFIPRRPVSLRHYFQVRAAQVQRVAVHESDLGDWRPLRQQQVRQVEVLAVGHGPYVPSPAHDQQRPSVRRDQLGVGVWRLRAITATMRWLESRNFLAPEHTIFLMTSN